MVHTKIARRYALALLSTALHEGSANDQSHIDFSKIQPSSKLVDTVLADLKFVVDVVKSSKDLTSLLKSPVVQHRKKEAIFKEVFESKIDKLVFAFIILLSEKNREKLLFEIANAFVELYNEIYNILPVTVFSAVTLESNQQKIVSEALQKRTGKTIDPTFKVKPELKAGAKVQIKDVVIDGSLQCQLMQLHKKLLHDSPLV
jgi:F-type H+-transporting ATPase subunit delta